MTAIKITVLGEKARAEGPFPFPFIKVISTLSGRKKWNGSKSVEFDFNRDNQRKLDECDYSTVWEDRSGEMKHSANLENMPTQHDKVKNVKTKYRPKQKLFKHQKHGLDLSWDRESYAWFLEMGLGKTAALIHNAGMLYMERGLRGVLVVAPNKVDDQWLDEQIPEHLDPRINTRLMHWGKKARFSSDAMNWFAINIDAVRTPKGRAACELFIELCDGKVMMIVDESHDIKNLRAARTKACIELGKKCAWRRIATGTPIGKNCEDKFSQFYFLDPAIIGHKYISSFRARYCITTMIQGRPVVVGQKRTEEFYGLVAPHMYRLTKDEAVDLPKKLYVKVPYEMGAETRHHYTNMKDLFMAQLEDGTITRATHAATMLLRLQQITNGFIVGDDGRAKRFSDERAKELLNILDQRTGKSVIWCRFKEDIAQVEHFLLKVGRVPVVYHGDIKSKDRDIAKERFLHGDATDFLSNPETGGTGLNLQGDYDTVIYYSNGFNSIKRRQSEDRSHRHGMKKQVTYFDIVASGSIDQLILNNLKGKKALSDLTLDEIRMAIDT